MRYVPFLAVLTTLGLVACSSSPSGRVALSDTQRTTITAPTVSPTSSTVTVYRDNRGTVIVAQASPDRVWSVLPAVYEALGIPLNTMDTQSQRMGNNEIGVRGRLAGERLSRYVNCGRDAFGRPSADSYNAEVSIMTNLIPTADGNTNVQTAVTAMAVQPGTSSDPVDCTSTGRLEQRMGDLLSELLEST